MKLCLSYLSGLWLLWLPAWGWAVEGAPAAIPTVMAHSEAFEIVGRLQAEGLVWFVDRTDSNEPVLHASLEVESRGQTMTALFRPEHGDYVIADPSWLAPLRSAGEHPLAITLMLKEDGDVFSVTLTVPAEAGSAHIIAKDWRLWIVGVALLLAMLWLWTTRRRKGGAA